MSVRRRTGAGIALNPDNIVLYWIIVCLLVAAVVAAGVASVEGLLHAAAWMVPPPLQWTLPVAVDVFLVGTALATLALRKRGARRPVIFLSVVTLALVAFSSVANYLYVLTSTEPGTEAHAYGPWIKAAMPVLLLASDVIEPGMVWHAEWPTGKSSLGITEWAWAEFPTWDEAMSAALAGVTS